MVAVAGAQDVRVEVAARVRREGAQKFLHELHIEIAHFSRQRILKNETGSAAEVDGDLRGDLVHGYQPVRKAGDAALVAERRLHAVAQRDAHVLDGVVRVHLQISLAG